MVENEEKVYKLMAIRAAFACAFLALGAIFYVRDLAPFPLAPLLIVIWLALLSNLFYGLIFPLFKKVETLASLQIVADLWFITLLVHFSGGVLSLFNSMYILSIIAASIVISRTASLQAASLAAILYGGLLDLEYYGIISATSFRGFEIDLSREYRHVLYTIAVNIAAFYAVALLSGHLAERLKKAGQKLRDRDQYLIEALSFQDYIVQNISSGLMTTDKEMRVTSFNHAAEVITGRRLEEVRGRPWTEVFGLTNQDLWRIFDKNLREGGQPFPFETRLIRKDGEAIPVGLSLSILTDNKGQPMGTVSIFHDLTALKEMEERLRRSERLMAVGQLAAGIAHEIRNPLGSISGAIQMLQEDLASSGEQRKLMEIIIKETDRLNNIVSQFLDFARQRPVIQQDCQLAPILEETIFLLKSSKDFSPQHQIELQIQDDSLVVWGNPDQLKQVFWNLAKNALQAMPEGGPLKITLTAYDGRKPSGSLPELWVQVDFEDRGPGISPQDLPHIFDPFYTTKDRGIGLGLSIVHRLVTDMGGAVEAQNREGQGTIFKVKLPLKAKSSVE